jgi:DNA-binding transcriptional LysR family regulator
LECDVELVRFDIAEHRRITGEARLMSLDQFATFATVAKHLNVTRAANQLHISQPAISRKLKLLQETYQSKFYRRGGRGIQLTKAGEIFLRECRSILSQMENLKKKLSNEREQSIASVLVVGSSYGPSETILPSLVALFRRSHPGTQVDVRTKDGRGIEQMVLKSEVEIGLVSLIGRSPVLTVEPFSEEEILPFVSVRHPMARKSNITLQEFSRAPLVVRRGAQGDMGPTERLLHNLARRGWKPNIVMRCESFQMVKAAVENRVGVGLLSRAIVMNRVNEGKLKILNVPEFRGYISRFIIYRKDRPLSSEAQDFLTLLRASGPLSKSPTIAAEQNDKKGRGIDRRPTQPASGAASHPVC